MRPIIALLAVTLVTACTTVSPQDAQLSALNGIPHTFSYAPAFK